MFGIITLALALIQVLLAKWDCSRDGHKFGSKDSHGFKSCSECGLTIPA